MQRTSILPAHYKILEFPKDWGCATHSMCKGHLAIFMLFWGLKELEYTLAIAIAVSDKVLFLLLPASTKPPQASLLVSK